MSYEILFYWAVVAIAALTLLVGIMDAERKKLWSDINLARAHVEALGSTRVWRSMDVKPMAREHGISSHIILVDMTGEQTDSNICFGFYNFQHKAWTFIGVIGDVDLKRARWCYMPIKQYERTDYFDVAGY